MQRYHAANCNSAVNNGALGGRPARDISCAESFLVPPSSYLNSRRSSQTPYNLRCDKEQLNPRIGPPDFHPQTPNCPEETLNREYVQSGYRDTVEGLEETREISLSQVQAFTRPSILKCKEAIRKCHRAINETRAQKRKAGQVYGVPLSGTLIIKPGIFPDQRPCSEDFRKKWIEGLSQRHKRLRSLADHVPHGYGRKSLFEVLIRNNVPLLRATWFIKVTYLNQVQPGTSGILLGVHDKIQFSRSEQWTKDIIEYLQYLLDEFVTRNNSHATLHITNQSPQMVCAGLMGQKREPLSAIIDGEEPSLYSKWWYVVRIIQWHHAEGLLIPSLVIDWVLRQLQEKELLVVLQLLAPIIYGVIQSLVLSQSYVRNLVGIAVHFIQETSPGGSDLVDNSRRTYTSSALVEMLRYLILAVPDTFVALDCIQLPSSVVNDRIFLSKVAEDARRAKDGPIVVTGALRGKGYEVQAKPISVDCVFSSIQKCAGTLARAARRDHPDHPGHNVAKALQALDKALMHGDVRVAYALLFENIWDEAVHECWIAEVSPCLRSLLKHIDTVPASLICSTFFICEWATCDFRDFRAAPPHDLKFTGRKDFSQIYIAIRLLKLKMSDMQKSNILKWKNKDIFESPSPLHDIIVCWIDQHEVHNGEGFKCLQLLIREFMLAGLFYPQAYVRQLFVSGIIDSNGPMVDLERQKRHYKILKQLPGPYICDVLEEARIAELPVVREAMIVYSNDRRLALRGLLGHNGTPGGNSSNQKQKHHGNSGGESASSSTVGQWYFQSKTNSSFKNPEMDIKLEELKALISVLLRLPNSSLLTKSGLNGSQGSFKSWVNDGTDVSEEGSGCEKCRRVKRQRLWEEQSFYLSPIPADEEETWWSRKGPKSVESFKVDPPPKPAKQVSRGRQKTVRKTQSLAQLAASRIEGSEGASTNYMCESRLSCSHHRTSLEDVSKSGDGIRSPHSGDIVSIGKVLKRMQLVDKRTVTVWLISVVKQLVEEAEKTAVKVGQYGRSIFDVDNQSPGRWKLGEDELSAILYMMDISNELLLAIRFLIWLLPKVPSSPGVTIHGGRNILIPTRNVENHACEVREAFLLSCIQRYENIIVAADLIPEVLSASMHRSAAVMASSDRLSSSPILVFSHSLLKKYKNVARVVEWENTFKSTSDRRLTSELDSGRSQEGDLGFPLGVPAGVGDPDDYFRQKIAGVRVSRVGLSMKDVVQRHVDEAFHSFYGKDRKVFGPGTNKTGSLEKWDDYYQIARQIVMGLMDCMRQTGGAAQEGDPSLVSSAIAAIIYNVGQVIAKIPDLATSNNQLNIPSPPSSLHFSQHILRIHITCLSILKEALGERQSRVFEVALAAEASSALVQASTPGKASRGQFHPSHYSNANLSNGILNNYTEVVLGKAEKIRAAVSALVIGTVLQGVASLERMVTLFRLKECLDLIQYVRSMKSNANGNARSMGLKVDNLVEVSVNWFRVLVGNCRTVCEGFIVELLGEASIIALSRMQQTLPLNLVFPPAYSILAFVIWRPFIFNASAVVREDIHQLYQSMALAIGDSIKHLPFRAVCLRNTYGLYDLIAADTLDSEFASILESNGANMHAKAAAFFPLRARLFLDALVDCRIPEPLVKQDDGSWMSGHVEPKLQCAENMKTFLDKLVGLLDTLQPARFHWQWVELRLLLNEQAIIEKLENHDISLNEAIRSLSPNPDKFGASESESNFIEIILTRLLVRPDAAPLFSEVVHLLGRSLEDSMLLQAKWFLRGQDVLYGRKSILQRLINIAESKGLATKTQFWKPWGWCHSSTSPRTKGERWKSEATSLEEGEVADEGIDFKHVMKGSAQLLDVEGFNVSKQHVTERALIELVLPCVDQGSDDSRNTFASEMIKQMNNIEYQINLVNCGACKPAATPSSGIDSPSNKSNSRNGVKGGSPGLARRSTGSADAMPPSPSALLVSLALRLQFLLRLLPIVRADRESPLRNMRYMLASVVLRLLGSRVVYEDSSHFVDPTLILSKRGGKSPTKTSAFLCEESLFDCLLLVLHALLSSYLPSWLKSKFDSKSTKYSNDFAVFDHGVAESLQNDLDRMILPETIRWRIQTAMPILFPSIRHSISCQPPSVSPAALSFLQPSNLITISNPSTSTLPQRNQASLIRLTTNVKTKPLPVDQDPDLEIDPWIVLEDGARSGQPSSNSTVNGSSDRANVKASNWLKGAIRVRRTDLTYIGSMDEDS